jgi:transposase
MANGCTQAIKGFCPNANRVIGKFHLVKKLNEATDEVRKEQWRKPEGDRRKTVKRQRSLPSMSSMSQTKGDP